MLIHLNTCMRAKSLQSCLTLCDSMDCTHRAPLSMGFSRQEYWSGLLCPSPGDLLDPGIETVSLTSPPLEGRFFTSATWEFPKFLTICPSHSPILPTLHCPPPPQPTSPPPAPNHPRNHEFSKSMNLFLFCE